MVQKSTASLSDLYLADETAWLDAMAALIREGRLTDLDYSHLAEYLTDMATRDRREVSSRLRVLLMHLLKWTFQPQMRTPSWAGSVLSQQHELEEVLESGVLSNYAETVINSAYKKATKEAARETSMPVDKFPVECPWTLDQLLSTEVLDK